MYRRFGGIVFAMVAALFAGACSASTGYSPPAREPAHHILYFVYTIGTANDDLQINYTTAEGGTAKDTVWGVASMWTKDVTTAVGVPGVSLQGSGYSSDLAFKVVCSIEIDGVKTESRGSYACSHTVDFARFASEHPPTTATPTPTPSATPSRVVRPDPVACKYVTPVEASGIVADNSGGVLKPVLDEYGDDTHCTYVFDYQTGRITFTWTAGKKAQGLPGTSVSGLGSTAYWQEVGMFGTLQVQRPKGLFEVTTSFQLLQIDQKAAAIAIYKAAKPRLP